MDERTLPLHGLRVLELSGSKGELAMRFLADLGADVVLVEWDTEHSARTGEPLLGTTTAYHEAFNANKRSLALDIRTPAGRATLDALLPATDVLFISLEPAQLASANINVEGIRRLHPHLVVTTFTHFGLTGPWRDWQGSEWVHLALGGALSRSGAPGREPLLAPLHMALQGAAFQAAWATLVAYAQRRVHGGGDLVDVSVHEAVVQVVDPGFGMAGSAAGGAPASDGPRGRVDYSFRYPFFAAADGSVRITILSPRQWAGMFEWLGRPEEFADPRWSSIRFRFTNYEVLYLRLAELFRTKTRHDVVSEAAQFGVPAASVLTPSEVLYNPHFAARGVFTTRDVPGARASITDGAVELDGRRAGIRRSAPAFGQHTEEVLREFVGEVSAQTPTGALGGAPSVRPDLPLAGIRVLDFGVIVAGGESGRLFADLGADVIKIENQAVPDGSRQSMDGATINVVFAWGNRNKRSIGIDVKSVDGQRLIRELVRVSDVLLSNFKPGTLESLGLTFEDLRDINPGILVVESSAFGHTGPWSANPGYGPIVRAAVGVTGLWQYDDDPTRFFDDVTIYPDHVAARVTATTVLARLLARMTSRRGGSIQIAQTEVSLMQHSHVFAAESLRPGSTMPVGNRPDSSFPRGLFAAAGDDEWVVVDSQTEAQRAHIVSLLVLEAGIPEHSLKDRDDIDTALADWIAAIDPETAMTVLQTRGIPAAKMYRVAELLNLPQLESRATFQIERHPLVPGDMPSEGQPARFHELPRVTVSPAPVLGEHTRVIASDLLGLAEPEIERLLGEGVLQEDAAGLEELIGALVTVVA